MSCPRNICLRYGHEDILGFFFLLYDSGFCVYVKSFSIFVYRVIQKSRFLFLLLYTENQLLLQNLMITHFFLFELTFWWKINWLNIFGSISRFYSVPLICSAYSSTNSTLFGLLKCVSSNFFSLKIVLAIVGPLHSNINFRTSVSISLGDRLEI